MNWNKYAQEVLAHVGSRPENLLISAVAGSGKTTLLDAAVRGASHRAVRGICAFSKPVAAELEARALGAYHTGTTHSFGFQWLREVFRSNYAAEKDRDIVDAVLRDAKFVENGEPYGTSALGELVALAKNTLVELTTPALRRLADTRDIAPEDPRLARMLPELALEALDRAARDVKRVSYDDMVWFPARYGLTRPTFDLLGVDEVQDQNRAQLYMSRALLRPGGQFVGVGDRAQSLFAFRGADSGAMDLAREMHGARELPLSVSYRCSRAVARIAREVVPGFEVRDDAPEGEAVFDVDYDDMLRGVRPGDFILSRTNAPLLGLASAVLARGHPVEVLRRDLGGTLTKMIYASGATTVEELLRYMDKRTARTRTDRTESEARHQAEAIRALAREVDDLGRLHQLIGVSFADSVGSEQKVTIGTVHAAKGLERDRVWLLGDTLQLWRDSQEEWNVYYVAVTRARQALYVIGDPHSSRRAERNAPVRDRGSLEERFRL